MFYVIRIVAGMAIFVVEVGDIGICINAEAVGDIIVLVCSVGVGSLYVW